ncbi:MAG TPA: hypothetical protein VF516_13235 [Kofleriaceae bacterium]
MRDVRRTSPRIDTYALCWELVDGREVSGLAVDLGALGLCVERPYIGGRTPSAVPLQLELPGTDEVMWATADPRFDTIIARGRQLIRRTGYRIALAARRDLCMLQEIVIETARLRAAAR